MRKFLLGSATVAALGALSAGAGATPNLLINGGFDVSNPNPPTPPPSSTSSNKIYGWTLTGSNTEYTNVEPTAFGYGAQGGSPFYVYEGHQESPSLTMLSQTFQDIPGDVLLVSGWLVVNGSAPSDFTMSVDGKTYIDVFNPGPSVLVPPPYSYVQYSFEVAYATGTDTLSIGMYDYGDSSNGIDNFVVTQVMPEPASMTVLAGGMVALGVVRRRRRTT